MTNAYHFETVEVGDKVAKLSPTDTPETAFITCERDCRYRFDGGEPTAVTGHLLRDGQSITLVDKRNIYQFRAISVEVAPATLSVTYERT